MPRSFVRIRSRLTCCGLAAALLAAACVEKQADAPSGGADAVAPPASGSLHVAPLAPQGWPVRSETAGALAESADPAATSQDPAATSQAGALTRLGNGTPRAEPSELGRKVAARFREIHRARLEAKRTGAAPPPEPKASGPSEAQDLPAEVAGRLESAYAVDRVEAVNELEPYGPGLDRLVGILSGDPSPEVRAAAAEQLGSASGYVAVGALLDASRDRDPRVVTKALEALEFVGDETITPTIRPLLQHPDDQVRAAAEKTIESLN